MKGKRKREIWRRIAALLLAVCLLGGCGHKASPDKGDSPGQSAAKEDESHEQDGESADSETLESSQAQAGSNRPVLLRTIVESGQEMADAHVAPYSAEPDFSNVENAWQFYMDDGMMAKLAENGFVVRDFGGSEFFEVYETNRYGLIPNFVTVDSLMHTYHLYFSYLMKNIERKKLSEALSELSVKMAKNSAEQYEALQGTEWEDAAARNVAFFAVGARLLKADVPAYPYAEEMISAETDKINSASGIAYSAVTGDEEDYTQYIPRGYYEEEEQLQNYFRAMMWYGRIHFIQEKEELDRSALLMTLSLVQDQDAYGLWSGIYAVTSFFAGASDDSGVCEYAPLIEKAYGKDVKVSKLAGDTETFSKFHDLTAKLSPPRINSVPIKDGENNVIPGFRFMGQRFTIDAAIMQNLIYQNVGADASGRKRMLPDVLDVAAALGSRKALEILEEQGDTAYAGYSENMEKLRDGLSRENRTLWSASLYAGWLNTLRPLLEEKGAGYPFFMQNGEWAKKTLECFAGSFVELKHDTVLYTKQVMAEMGGGMEEQPDDRGYVEPEPLVFARFSALASQTAEGLERYGMLPADDRENLMLLAEMAERFLVISNKELRDETLTEEEYEFIRCYGGNIEHFWADTVQKDTGVQAASELPAAVVTDIATDPNGSVLEIATGTPSTIFVLVKVDGKIKIASGSVYRFYQFPWPMDDRLTDSKWRYMMGYQADENGYYWRNYDAEPPVQQPEWTQSYR